MDMTGASVINRYYYAKKNFKFGLFKEVQHNLNYTFASNRV